MISGVSAPRIFDGLDWHDDACLLSSAGQVRAIVPIKDVPDACPINTLTSGFIAPGFIDLQVNGGGDALFNASPNITTLRTICAAHQASGTMGLLPTLISSSQDVLEQAIATGRAAQKANVPGFMGLHLEGPHLAAEKPGAHDANHFRPLTEQDADRYIAARQDLPNLLITLAPEAATTAMVTKLAAGGVMVSLGHTNTTYEQALDYFKAGACMVTHLFNAMSGLDARNPGLIAAALHAGVGAGLIADGHHVHAASIWTALSAKIGAGQIFLVSDAMPTAGGQLQEFMLNKKRVQRHEGKLTFEDGTLAGADLTMLAAVRHLHQKVGVPRAQALKMATLYPAAALGIKKAGLVPGAPADFIALTDTFDLMGVWRAGQAS